MTELSQPTVALVVNVQPVHLEKLGSLEAIRKEKVSIARGLPSDGILVLPVDLAAPEWPGRVLRFGAGADVHAMSKVPAGESWDVTADIAGRHLAFSLTPGAPHRLHNALAALASVAAAGLDPVLLARELGEVGIMTGRGVEQRIGEIVLIDDSFNGNPASMAAALDSLQARPVRGRRIAVIGDMLELGDEAPAYHADMVGHVTGIDGVYCVGPLMRHLFEKLPPEKRLGWHEDPATLDASQVAALLAPDDVVVIKGSKKIFWVNKFVQKLAAALQASN